MRDALPTTAPHAPDDSRSDMLESRFPRPGTICLGQSLKFLKPVHVGDTLTVTLTVRSLDDVHHRLVLSTTCTDQDGDIVVDDEAEVLAPSGKLRIQRAELPEPFLADKNLRYGRLLAAAAQHAPIRMGVVHPCSMDALEGAIDAARLGLIEAVLIGPSARIRSLAADNDIDISGLTLVEAPHSHGAAAQAVAMAREGKLAALMKGSLHTDELLSEAVNADRGLRTARRMSHVFVLDVPRYPKPLLITDAAMNVTPDFAAKVDIVQNAIDLAHALGTPRPKVAIIRSEVAGDADILVVPDLESGNMLAKQLEYLGDAQSAGIVIGATVPIVLTSRADSAHSRIASCAIALLWHHFQRQGVEAKVQA